MRQNALQNGASAGAKHAGKKRRTCMLMMPGPSSWAAGATGSRSPVGGDRNVGPKVDPPAAVAAEEAHVADEIACSVTTSYCHIKADKIPGQYP